MHTPYSTWLWMEAKVIKTGINIISLMVTFTCQVWKKKAHVWMHTSLPLANNLLL